MDVAPEQSDEDLVRRVLAGDAAAATLLFDRHLTTLRAAARRRLPPLMQGKVGESDVVQDAWLAAFLHLADFEDRGGGSFERWLRQILERKIANEIRDHVAAEKRDVRREVRLSSQTGGGAAPAHDQTTPSESAMADEESHALRASIDELPEDHRTVIQLVHREGLTLVEAGARMGRSADAARKLYGRAMARLGERLRGAGGESV
jgi:RNA polymerase sigma-70 factor (ECF subfamily)